MSTAVLEQVESALNVDPTLTKALVESTIKALKMCSCNVRCVGVNSLPVSEGGIVTGMIGVHGKVSGFATVNMSERLGVKSVEGLLQDKFGKLTSQVVDGVGEITNMVVGGIKGMLANTTWGFTNITVPSVIIGQGYHINYARGLTYLTVSFEDQDSEAIMLNDRMLHVSISLLKL
jgi:chemotaxis protein CheX